MSSNKNTPQEKKWKKYSWISATFLLSILFLYAAISKLLIYSIFRDQLSVSPFIKSYSNILVWLIPAIEIVISIMLITRKYRLLGMYFSFFLMLAFTTYTYYLLHFAPTIPCGCGGIISKLDWKGHLIFNSSFTALAALGVYCLPQTKQNTNTNKLKEKYLAA